MTEEDKVLYGGPLTFDISKDVGSLGEYVLKILREKDGHKIVLTDATAGRSLCYRDLIERSFKVAAYLRENGIQKGDVVAIFTENCLEFPVIICGCFYLGVAVNACSPSYTEKEIGHVLQLTKPRMIFASSTVLKKILKVSSNCDFLKKVILIDGQPMKKDRIDAFGDILRNKNLKLEENFRPAPVDKSETIGLIQMSSGTTGLLKAVVNTQNNVLNAMGVSVTLRRGLPIPIATSFCAVPFCHTYGMFSVINNALGGGQQVVFMRKFSGRSFLEAIQRYKIESLSLVPSIWVFLSKSPLVDKYDLSSVKALGSGAASLSKEVEESTIKRFEKLKPRAAQGYGMTEATITVIARVKGVYKAGSIGSLLPGVYSKVVDPDTGKICGPNEPGEMWFRGKCIMKGYLGNEKATREMIDAEGWLHSGDIGYYDENGHFYIVDRLKELIKYKGYQVPPAQLEDILLSHPAVLDAAVVGVPDQVSGELPRAFIVRNLKEKKFIEKDIIDFVDERVSDHMRLRGGVQFISAIPRNPNGKIMRRVLRKMVKNPVSKL